MHEITEMSHLAAAESIATALVLQNFTIAQKTAILASREKNPTSCELCASNAVPALNLAVTGESVRE